MKIATWNVFNGNPRMDELYKFVLKQKPDILCLQEINEMELKKLKEWSQFNLVYTEDFTNRRGRGNVYTCLLTKYDIKNSESFLYSKKKNHSLLNGVLYEFIVGNTEVHKALYVDMVIGDVDYRIFTARLSTAVGSRDRIRQLRNVIKKFKKGARNIIAGDLNIPSSYLFSVAVGWVQGFKPMDYVIHDYKLMKREIKKVGLKNVHEGMSTLGFRWSPRVQLDYILVPEKSEIKKKSVSPHGFGSDHRMVFVEI